MERTQGNLGDSGEGEGGRKEGNSCLCVFAFPSVCPQVSLWVSLCICFMSLLLSPQPYYLSFISNHSDISPTVPIIITVSLPSVRHEEFREGSAELVSFTIYLFT